jgi:hypothetical protein
MEVGTYRHLENRLGLLLLIIFLGLKPSRMFLSFNKQIIELFHHMLHRIILLSKKSHYQVKFNSNIKFKIKKKPN